jgi:hypothetical protein
MKNIVISPMSQKEMFKVFFAGFLYAFIFGVVFGFMGIFFASYLGFDMSQGSEEIMMGASMVFYSIIFVPIGAFLGTHFAIKKLPYKSNILYSYIALLLSFFVGLLIGDYFSLYIFLLYMVVSSIIFTIAISLSVGKK